MVQHRVDSIKKLAKERLDKENLRQENLDFAEIILELQYEIELLKMGGIV